jgi:hypothetical protein
MRNALKCRLGWNLVVCKFLYALFFTIFEGARFQCPAVRHSSTEHKSYIDSSLKLIKFHFFFLCTDSDSVYRYSDDDGILQSDVTAMQN